MAQTYTASGAITIPTTIPADQGQTVSLTNIGQAELNYASAIRTDAQDFQELQDLIALWCRATTGGLSTAAVPVSAREVITKMIFMLQSMQRANEVYS